jgi:hypothetical protein
LRAGDRLVYDLTIEQQVHGVPPAHAKVTEVTKDGAGEGTELISISSVAPDGSARARVAVDFVGVYDRKPLRAHQTFDASISPDGQMRASGIGHQAEQAFTLANMTAREFSGMQLHVGQVWRSVEPLPNSPGVLRLLRRIVKQTDYHGLPTFVVQTVGNGAYRQALKGQIVDSAVSLTGTSYYDSRDRLFVGAAVRTLSLVSYPQSHGAHVNATSRINVMLRDFTHSAAPATPARRAAHKYPAPLPVRKPLPSPSPSAQAAPAPSGAALPSPVPTTPVPRI